MVQYTCTCTCIRSIGYELQIHVHVNTELQREFKAGKRKKKHNKITSKTQKSISKHVHVV